MSYPEDYPHFLYFLFFLPPESVVIHPLNYENSASQKHTTFRQKERQRADIVPLKRRTLHALMQQSFNARPSSSLLRIGARVIVARQIASTRQTRSVHFPANICIRFLPASHSHRQVFT